MGEECASKGGDAGDSRGVDEDNRERADTARLLKGGSEGRLMLMSTLALMTHASISCSVRSLSSD